MSLVNWTGGRRGMVASLALKQDTGGGGGGPHAASHKDGGSDEIDLSALSGLLADAQAPLAHAHVIADTTGLQTILDGKADDAHSHVIADVTGLQGALDGKAATAHTHAIADTTGLQTALDGKAALAHTHAAVDVASGTLDIARIPTGQTGVTVSFGDDARFTDARTPVAHTHPASDVASGTLAIARIPTGQTGSTVPFGNDARFTDARTPVAHTHPASDVDSGTLAIARVPTGQTGSTVPFGNDVRFTDARTPTAHATSHKSGGSDAVKLDELAAPTDITTLDATTVQHGLMKKYPGGTTTFLRADGTFAAPPSDPWTYLKVAGSNFTTTSASAVDVTGLGFAPSANTNYEFEGLLLIRTATTTVNPRVGLAWPTGGTDGIAEIIEEQAATGTPLFAAGNINAALLIAAGGLPNTTQSWPVRVRGLFQAGATPSGNVRMQLASETAGTTVQIQIGSFLRYRIIP